MTTKLKIQQKVTIWQEFEIDAPGYQEHAVNEVKNNPSCNDFENNGIYRLDETEQVLETIVFDENGNQLAHFKLSPSY